MGQKKGINNMVAYTKSLIADHMQQLTAIDDNGNTNKNTQSIVSIK